MKKLLISLIICSICALDLSPAQTSPTAYPVPFDLRNDFLITFQGRIGPLNGLKFILDTGTNHSVIDKKIADRLSLPRVSDRVLNFEKYVPVEWADFREIQFGPFEVHDASLMVLDLEKYSALARNADAIIGLDLLYLAKGLIIDYSSRTLHFLLNSTSETLTFQRKPVHVLTVPVTVQGYSAELLVDSGVERIILYEDRFRKHAPGLKLEEEKVGLSIGRLHVKQARLPGVQLGSVASSRPVVFLMDGPSPDELVGIDGCLGLSALHARQVEFNFEAHTLAWVQ